jgi:hypothetical protein
MFYQPHGTEGSRMFDSRRQVLAWAAAFVVAIASTGGPARSELRSSGGKAAGDPGFCEETLHGQTWARTELYFGLSRSGGPDITDDEFRDFLDREVTPRFPDGLTLLTGDGQFRGSSGFIVRERSKLLILFYPWNPGRNRAVERIRTLYKREFDQEAVLRVDSTSCVSF